VVWFARPRRPVKNLLIPLRAIWSHPLSGQRPWSALWRFVRWQIQCRLHKTIELAFVDTARLSVARGMTGLTGNVYCGLHEFETMAFLLHLLRADDLFVDVGANAGSYTVLAAAVIGSEVIAVEPAPLALAALSRNIQLNRIDDRVEVHPEIAAETSGAVEFVVDQDTVNHVATHADAHAARNRIVTSSLDSMLAGRSPTLIKLDVEGYELSVLRGAAACLHSESLLAVIVEINGSEGRYGLPASDLIDLFHAAGFGCCRYDGFSRQLADADPTQTCGNAIFVRRRDEVARRLGSARQFHICAVNQQL